jgi:hypothetical protein
MMFRARKDHGENIFKIRLKITPRNLFKVKKRDHPMKNKDALIIKDVFERPKMAAVRISRRITKLN